LGFVAQGLAVPENARPQPLHGRGPTPAEELIVKVLEACLKALCAREKLSSAFIASRTDLETLVRRYRQGALAPRRQSHPGRVARCPRRPGTLSGPLRAGEHSAPPPNRAGGVYTAHPLTRLRPCDNAQKPGGKARHPVAARSKAAAFAVLRLSFWP